LNIYNQIYKVLPTISLASS